MEASCKRGLLLVVVKFCIAVYYGARFARDWITVTAYTTGLYSIANHSGGILMEVGRIYSTKSLEKAKIFPYVDVSFVKETDRRSMTHRTLIWWGGPLVMTSIDGRSLKDRDASVFSHIFYSRMYSSLRRSNILEYACMSRSPCCPTQTGGVVGQRYPLQKVFSTP